MNDMEDYNIDSDVYCPKCKHSPLHYRSCSNLYCEDGSYEEFLDDLEIPGTGYDHVCEDCKGTGVEWWCPECGAELSGDKELTAQFRALEEYAEWMEEDL